MIKGKQTKRIANAIISKYKWFVILPFVITLLFSVVLSIAGLNTIIVIFIGTGTLIVVYILVFLILKSKITEDILSRKFGNTGSLKSQKKGIKRKLIIILVAAASVIAIISVIISMLTSNSIFSTEFMASVVTKSLTKRWQVLTEEGQYVWVTGTLSEYQEALEDPDTVVVEGDTSLPSQDNPFINTGSTAGMTDREIFLSVVRGELAEWQADSSIMGGYKYWDWSWTMGKGFKSHNPNSGTFESSVTPGVYGWSWCSTFVAYCIKVSGLGDDSADVFNNIVKAHYPSCNGLSSFFSSFGMKHYDIVSNPNFVPQPGDIVFYFGGSKYCHVGIVNKVEGDYCYTIEGNTNNPNQFTRVDHFCFESAVAEGGFKYRGSGFTHVVYYRPEFNDEVTSGTTGSFGFNLSIYNREPVTESTPDNITILSDGTIVRTRPTQGYYSADDMERILYDYLTKYLGLNDAGAAGIMGNVWHESKAKYDQIEVYGGTVTYSANSSIKCSPATKYGNGNWTTWAGGFNEFISAMKMPKGFIKSNGKTYGMGYGLIQWSNSRKASYYDFCVENNLVMFGPDSLASQLQYWVQDIKTGTTGGESKGLWKKFMLTGDTDNTVTKAEEAAYYFCHYNERPAGHINGSTLFTDGCKNRMSKGREFFIKYTSTEWKQNSG